jgi:N-acylneuraminate cytidylyltransferase
MVKNPEVLVIVPARGGSKGIPRKNIRKFAGYPLIAYSIRAGLDAETVTRVIVSTDDEEIAAVAREWGAETPFLRPVEFAEDTSTDLPVFEHALQWLAINENYHPEVVIQLRPTSPIRPKSLVDDAVHMMLEHPEADSVRGIVPAGQNPHKMWRLDPGSGQMIPLLKVSGIGEPYNAPRQILPPIYWQTGHIDVIRPATILEKNSMSGDVILPIVVDPRFTVDIDNPMDWGKAEWLVWNAGLDMVDPAKRRRPLPEKVRLVVMDFDGTLTDNRVWVDLNGHEMVAANRGDGWGIKRLKTQGVEFIVISSEVNSVVEARCRKLGITAVHGVLDKPEVLKTYLEEHQIPSEQVVFFGNDLNDVPCFPLVGCAVVVADAEPEAKREADLVLSRNGGHGAARELCDMILNRMSERS